MNITRWHNRNEILDFPIGAYVKIREDLQPNKRYGVNSTNRCMPYYAGITTQVGHIVRGDSGIAQYLLQADGLTWFWTKEMLERAHPDGVKANKKIIVGDTVAIRDDLIVGEVYGNMTFSRGMVGYMGQTARIEDAVQDDTYAFFILDNESTDWWAPEMLIKLEAEQ